MCNTFISRSKITRFNASAWKIAAPKPCDTSADCRTPFLQIQNPDYNGQNCIPPTASRHLLEKNHEPKLLFLLLRPFTPICKWLEDQARMPTSRFKSMKKWFEHCVIALAKSILETIFRYKLADFY
jgi:hypothetical protein